MNVTKSRMRTDILPSVHGRLSWSQRRVMSRLSEDGASGVGQSVGLLTSFASVSRSKECVNVVDSSGRAPLEAGRLEKRVGWVRWVVKREEAK